MQQFKKGFDVTEFSRPQLSLGLGSELTQSFDNYYVSPANTMLVGSLKSFIEQSIDDFVYVAGADRSGKTHLLSAAYNFCLQKGRQALLLPMQELIAYQPEEVLAGHEQFTYVFIDDVQLCAQSAQWQEALFNLYNTRQSLGLSLVFAANTTAALLEPSILKDLRTRLEACLSFQLQALNDDELSHLLLFLADLRGMVLPEQCIQFILLRAERDIQSLKQLMDELDEAQISAGRKITVPFIKSLFNW